MPVSVRSDPFATRPTLSPPGAPRASAKAPRAKPTKSRPASMRTAHARVLAVLVPAYPDDPVHEWVSRTVQGIARTIGVSDKSDYVRRALRGLPEGSSSGYAHDGLLSKKYVESFEVDVEGTTETYYRITSAGMRAMSEYLADGPLPSIKSADLCTNLKYRTPQEGSIGADVLQ